MNTNIKTTGITLTPSISAYIEKRIKKISKFLGKDPSLQCDIEVGKTTSHHLKGDIFKAEIHIVGKGRNLFATSERDDLYAAIDDVRDEILGELKASKEKRMAFVRRGGAKVKAMVKGLWPWKKS